MKRTTVYLDESVDRELTRLARLEGRSKAELIREVLGEHIGERQKGSSVPEWVGIASGSGDLAKRGEEVLAELLEEKQRRIEADFAHYREEQRKKTA